MVTGRGGREELSGAVRERPAELLLCGGELPGMRVRASDGEEEPIGQPPLLPFARKGLQDRALRPRFSVGAVLPSDRSTHVASGVKREVLRGALRGPPALRSFVAPASGSRRPVPARPARVDQAPGLVGVAHDRADDRLGMVRPQTLEGPAGARLVDLEVPGPRAQYRLEGPRSTADGPRASTKASSVSP